MEFQIERLIVWSREGVDDINQVEFHPGMVNVVTGDTRTGKSAIIPIIDYCLGSTKCLIPVGIIREQASWYGLLVRTAGARLLLARKRPDGDTEKPSACYYAECALSGEWTPPPRLESNIDITAFKQKLNEVIKVPYVEHIDTNNHSNPLSYRDLLHLVFQSQDVVANQNVLFFKMHEVHNRIRFQRWFNFLLAAESAESIQARQQQEDAQKEIRTIEDGLHSNEQSKADSISRLRASMLDAIGFGIGYKDGKEPEDDKDVIKAARSIVCDPNIKFTIDEEQLLAAAEAVRELKQKETDTDLELSKVEQRITSIEELLRTFREEMDAEKIDNERLKIGNWIQSNWAMSAICPVCGGNGHKNGKSELNKVVAAVKAFEEESQNRSEALSRDPLPRTILRDLRNLKQKRKNLLAEKKRIQIELADKRRRNAAIEQYARRQQDGFKMIGRIEDALKALSQISAGDPASLARLKELKSLKSELAKHIQSKTDIDELREQNLGIIGTSAQMYLKELDADKNSCMGPVQFSLQDINLKITTDEAGREYHLLGEVGSGSNWVACHIAYTCALEEFFLSQESCVPNFVVYDQPSQVYFPKMQAGDLQQLMEKKDADGKADLTDYISVRKMFVTLSKSIEASGGRWQAIVLEHANDDIYKNIPRVVEVKEWRNGKKLIPEWWVSGKRPEE